MTLASHIYRNMRVNNPKVMAEVIDGLSTTTFEPQLNGKKVNILQKDWKICGFDGLFHIIHSMVLLLIRKLISSTNSKPNR